MKLAEIISMFKKSNNCDEKPCRTSRYLFPLTCVGAMCEVPFFLNKVIAFTDYRMIFVRDITRIYSKANHIFDRLMYTPVQNDWDFFQTYKNDTYILSMSINTIHFTIYLPNFIKFRNRVTAQCLPKVGHVRKTRCKTEMQVSHTNEIPASATTH